MRFISIDTETTGLHPDKHQVLQIGAVFVDTKRSIPLGKRPTFSVIIDHGDLCGHPFALNLNADIIERIATGEGVTPLMAVSKFAAWLEDQCGYEEDEEDHRFHITTAGKNVGSFDQPFLERLPGWNNRIKIRHRSIDPAIMYINWEIDEKPPSLEECIVRAGVADIVTHDALQDALLVAEIILTIKEVWEFP